MKSVFIIGCGWLGLPLALRLREQGYTVAGSTSDPIRQKTLESKDIPVYADIFKAPLSTFDIVICTIPPLRDQNNDYHHHLARYIQAQGPKQFIYTSSISVYPDIPELLDESRADRQSKQFALEEIYRKQLPEAMILRLGGLFGWERHPAHYLSGRKNIAKPEAPINLISGLEVIGAIEFLLRHDKQVPYLNLVNDDQRSRKEYYTAICEELGIPIPEFEISSSGGKRIDNQLWKSLKQL